MFSHTRNLHNAPANPAAPPTRATWLMCAFRTRRDCTTSPHPHPVARSSLTGILRMCPECQTLLSVYRFTPAAVPPPHAPRPAGGQRCGDKAGTHGGRAAVTQGHTGRAGGIRVNQMECGCRGGAPVVLVEQVRSSTLAMRAASGRLWGPSGLPGPVQRECSHVRRWFL